MTGGSARCEGLGQALHVRELRALRAAEVGSVAGDRSAQVGLGIRVSPPHTAAQGAPLSEMVPSWALEGVPAVRHVRVEG